MELADALKVLAASRHFDDLDLALRYVGCVRSEETPEEIVPTPEDTAAGGADQTGLPSLEDGVAHDGTADGWSLLTEAQIEEAARDAESRNTARDGGRDRRRREHSATFIVPMVLDATGEQPQPAPAYNSVPPPRSSHRSPATAAHSAINPRTGKATMHPLFKRPAQSTEIDVSALVERLSLALPILDTPRLERNLTVGPMHLLYDTSLLIGPYADDVRQLVRLARALFDVDVLEIRAYRNTLRGGCGSGPVWTWRPFRFPRRPATVVFVSGSFGGDLETRVLELEEIVRELERRGHRACVLWLGDPPRPSGVSLRSWRMIRT